VLGALEPLRHSQGLDDERLPPEGPFRPESHRRWRSTPSPCPYLPSPSAASATSLPHTHLERVEMHRRKFAASGAAARKIAEPQPPACSRGKDTWSGEKGGQARTSLGHVTGSNAKLARGHAPLLILLLRRSPFPHREAARCSARLDRSGVATCLNDERSFFEGPSRTESHCRWRPTPSPCSRLLSHDLTHVRPPLRLPFTLISNAMACTGASRHLGRPHTSHQPPSQSRSLNHQRAHGARTRGPAKAGGRRRRRQVWDVSSGQMSDSLQASSSSAICDLI
jgi:hypothetical protein